MVHTYREAFNVGLTVTLLAVGCAAPEASDGGIGEASQAIAIPGPWNPPADVRAAVAGHRVTVTEPPNVHPGGSCPGSDPFALCTHPACTPAHPGTSEVSQYILNRWDYSRNSGVYNCRRNSNNLDELSVHAIGRAIDIGIREIGPNGDQANNTEGDAIANWLITHAEHIGIQRVGWDGMWWNGQRGFLVMQGDPHTNHLHIEMSEAGAARLTPFFSQGPPAETCPVVCYGTAVVNADCSVIDCAESGQVCLSSPVRCAVPEPATATVVSNPELPPVATLGAPQRFELSAPKRLFDTREAALSTDLVRGDGSTSGPLTSETTNQYIPTGLSAETTGLWLNAASISRGMPGFVSVFPAFGEQPATSNVNFHLDGVRANAVPVLPLGARQGIDFYASAEVDLVVDQIGSFAPEGQGLIAVNPTRVYDSREHVGLEAGKTREISVRAPTGATAAVASVAVVAGSTPGFLSVFACGDTPTTSHINYAPSQVIANTVVAPLRDGKICLQSLEAVDVVVDVNGYLAPNGPLSYQAFAPVRLLDTRTDTSPYTGRLGSGQRIELPVQGLAGMPNSVWTVMANVTAIGADEPGFVTVFPCDGGQPLSSSVNYSPGDVATALTVSRLGPAGTMCLFAHSRAHLVVDLFGVWVDDDGRTPPAPPASPAPGGGASGSGSGGDPMLTGSCAAHGGAGASFGCWLALALIFARRRFA